MLTDMLTLFHQSQDQLDQRKQILRDPRPKQTFLPSGHKCTLSVSFSEECIPGHIGDSRTFLQHI